MRTPIRTLLFCAAATLASGCDSLFFVEAEAEEVCKTEQNVSFPGALPGTASIQQSFELPIGDVGAGLPGGDMESELELKVFEVTVTGGGADLRSIERATVALRQPGTTTTITLIEYVRPANATSGTTLSLTATAPVDVLELARQESLELSFEARGSLPQQSWTANLRACAGVRAKVDYFDLAF
jgi:hypothetical protein